MSLRSSAALLAAAAALSVTGCATAERAGDYAGALAGDAREHANTAVEAARRAAAPPHLTPIRDPSGLTGGAAGTMPQPVSATVPAAAPNSLWRAGSRTFFEDQRAKRIGDILTVDIRIADRAEVTNSSSRTRSSSTEVGVDNFFGLEQVPGRFLPGQFDPGSLVSASADSSANGQGTVNREEEVELTVAAVVVEILPNGNLVIAGRQEVLINAELRELTVTGVIRPEDIASDNTIRHDQIAEARIAYGGRGQVTAVQRPRIGQRIADAISPF